MFGLSGTKPATLRTLFTKKGCFMKQPANCQICERVNELNSFNGHPISEGKRPSVYLTLQEEISDIAPSFASNDVDQDFVCKFILLLENEIGPVQGLSSLCKTTSAVIILIITSQQRYYCLLWMSVEKKSKSFNKNFYDGIKRCVNVDGKFQNTCHKRCPSASHLYC